MQGHMGKAPGLVRRQKAARGSQRAFIGVSTGKAKQGRVNSLGLATLNNVDRFRARGLVFSCLVLGPE